MPKYIWPMTAKFQFDPVPNKLGYQPGSVYRNLKLALGIDQKGGAAVVDAMIEERVAKSPGAP